MTVFEHPDWPLVLEHLFIRRGTDGVNGPRHRIEVRRTAPLRVFAMRTSCAHCGREIHNVRQDARGGWTFNVSCPLSVDMRCARMAETTATCDRIRHAMEGRGGPVGLFDMPDV